MTVTDFEVSIKSGARCHMVGIGGVSMSPLAELLFGLGIPVTGSDMNESPAVEKLRAMGVSVAVGHDAGNVAGAGYIIRTAAAREDNLEISEARRLGLPVFERAEAWGYIMRGYKNAVCVSGTHGKTTTTSMTTHILLAAGADPTVMIGGTLATLGSGYRVGAGDTIVLESCEYYNSFHSFSPTVAVVLNVDADHLDFFRDLDGVKASFRRFASLVPSGGHIVCNADDANTLDALAPLGRPLFTFGQERGARVRAVNVRREGAGHSFDIQLDGARYCRVRLHIPGLHNVANALAAAAACITLGIPAAAIERGLAEFTGVGRRFEYKGSYNGAVIYDDYAHHPREVDALLDSAFSLGKARVILAFQPHTYTRTKALFGDFARVLSRADIVLLAEIYAAREKNAVGISSKELAAAVPGAVFCPSLEEMAALLREQAREDDIIITAGAGDIYKVGEMLLGG